MEDFLLDIMSSAAVASAFIAAIIAKQGSRMLAGMAEAPPEAGSGTSRLRATRRRR